MPVMTLERPSAEPQQRLTFDKSNRIDLIDFLRGLAMVFVIFYHFIYDLIDFGGLEIPFFNSQAFDVVHTFFLVILIGVSGICSTMSRDVVKRGAVMFLLGSLLTIGTDIVMPDDVIVFGVLTFFGTMMMLCGVTRPLTEKLFQKFKAAPYISAVAFVLLYVIFRDFSDSGIIHLWITDIKFDIAESRDYLYPLGIKSDDFHSADYFPLVPFGFVYLAGASISKAAKEGRLPRFFYRRINCPSVNFMGRHSLIIYIVHQPILILIVVGARLVIGK